MGVRFMFRGMTLLHTDSPDQWKQNGFLGCWMALYGLVGAQMGWLLCPFFSSTNVWLVKRGPGSESVFEAIFSLIPQLFR
jgi:hypothetical protein